MVKSHEMFMYKYKNLDNEIVMKRKLRNQAGIFLKINCISIVLFLVSTSRINAQSRKLSLQEAIQIATENSFDAFKNENNLRLGMHNLLESKNNLKPNLSWSLTPANYNRSLQQVYSSSEKQMVYQDIHNFTTNTKLTLSQNIGLTGGTLSASTGFTRYEKFGNVSDLDFISTPISLGYSQKLFAVNELKWESQLAPVEFERVKRNYIYELERISIKTLGLYFDLLTAESILKLAENNLKRAENLFSMGKKRYEINTISLDELYQLDLRLLKSQNALESIRIDYEEKQRSLVIYLGLDMDTKIECVVPSFPAVSKFDYDDLIVLAELNNPKFSEIKYQQMLAERAFKREKAKRFSVNMDLGIGLNNNANTPLDAYINPTETENVKLSLNVPVFDWGSSKREIKLAELDMEEIVQSKQIELLNLYSSLQTLAREYNIQKKRIENAMRADTLAKAAYSIIEERFKNGQVGILNINDAQNEIESRKSDYLNSLENYWQSYYEVRQICLVDFEKGISLEMRLDENLNRLNFWKW